MSGYPGYPPGGGGHNQQQPGSGRPNPEYYYQASDGNWYPRASAQQAQPGRSTQEAQRPAESESSSDEGPNWRFFIPGDGISREVIQADIQRYLGNEAVCKPAKNPQGVKGYAISAYRNFTAAQIEDLRADSKAWEKEKTRNPKKARTYERSMIHRERQHYGATDQRPAPNVPAPQLAESPQYTHVSPNQVGQHQRQEGGYSYDANNPASAPRSAPPAYSPFAQGGNFIPGQPQQQIGQQQPAQQQPAQQAQTHPPAPAGYYLASDGNYYRIPT